MTSVEKIKEIATIHHGLMFPEISKIERTSLINYGIFAIFEDSIELKREGKFRFINNHNKTLFREDRKKTGVPNKKFSIVIDVEDIIAMSIVDETNL